MKYFFFANLFIFATINFCVAQVPDYKNYLTWETSYKKSSKNIIEATFVAKFPNVSLKISKSSICSLKIENNLNENFKILKDPFVHGRSKKIKRNGDEVYQDSITIKIFLKKINELEFAKLKFGLRFCTFWEAGMEYIERSEWTIVGQSTSKKRIVVGFFNDPKKCILLID